MPNTKTERRQDKTSLKALDYIIAMFCTEQVNGKDCETHKFLHKTNPNWDAKHHHQPSYSGRFMKSGYKTKFNRRLFGPEFLVVYKTRKLQAVFNLNGILSSCLHQCMVGLYTDRGCFMFIVF